MNLANQLRNKCCGHEKCWRETEWCDTCNRFHCMPFAEATGPDPWAVPWCDTHRTFNCEQDQP